MNKKFIIVYLGILAAMAPLATDMYLPSLPEVQTAFGITTSLTQMTLTMTMLGMSVGQIFAGPISDLVGRKIPLIIGMIIFMIASVLCMMVENIYIFLAARLVQGLAGACGVVIARAIARDICEGAELTTFYAILMMVNGLAPIIAPVIGGQVLIFGTWRIIFGLLAAIGMILVFVTLVFKETLPKNKRIASMNAALRIIPKLLTDKYFMGHCLVQSFIFMSFFTYIGSSSFIFQGIYGLSAQEYSMLFGGIGIGLFLMGPIPARLAGVIADSKMLWTAITCQLIGGILLLGAFLFGFDSFGIIVTLLAISIVPLSVMAAASFSMALTKQGRNAGSASALLGFFSSILGAFAMPLSGHFGTDTGIPMAVIMVIGFICAQICYWMMIYPEHAND